MRPRLRVWPSLVFACALAVAPGIAHGGVCADADDNGLVTVTDGVRMLRAAALLGPCPHQVCDLNLDGQVSVTDGVLALRMAASIPTTATCAEAQTSELVDTAKQVLEVGLSALPARAGARRRARAAQTTTPCTEGGATFLDDTHIEFFQCGEDGFVMDGTFTFSETTAGDFLISTSGFTIFDTATVDTSILVGTLTFTFDGDNTIVNGTLGVSSDLLGEFDQTFTNVVLDIDSIPIDGELLTSVKRGTGAFARVRTLKILFRGPLLVLADVTFDAGAMVSVFIDDGAGVCLPCVSSDECNTPLACFPCADQCTGQTSRCTVADLDITLECEDGFF